MVKRIKFLLLLLIIIGCGGGGGDNNNGNGGGGAPQSPTFPTEFSFDFGNNNPNLYVAFGDSLTRGFGSVGSLGRECPVITGEGYPPKLERMLNSTVINEGICGERTIQGVERIKRILTIYKPGFILIMEGSNDAAERENPAFVKSNLRKMIQSAKNNKTIPIIATLPPACCSHKAAIRGIELINNEIRQLAIEEGVVLADVHSDMYNDPRFIENFFSLLSSDGLHPNDAGYEIIASSFYNAILMAKNLAVINK